MKQKLKLPKSDNGHGKWREREIYIAPGRRSRQRTRYGLAGEDSSSPQKWSLRSRSVHLRTGSVLQSQSVHHGANSLGMKVR